MLFIATIGDITTCLRLQQRRHHRILEADLVLLHWGEDASPVPDGWTSQLPFGSIDQDELDAVLLNWGNAAANVAATTIAVPEPATAALLLIASVTALAWRQTTQRFPPLRGLPA